MKKQDHNMLLANFVSPLKTCLKALRSGSVTKVVLVVKHNLRHHRQHCTHHDRFNFTPQSTSVDSA